jgi:hypothetical protein
VDVLDGSTRSETQSGLPWERHNRLEYVKTLDSPLGKLFNAQSDKFAASGSKEESSCRRAYTGSSRRKCFVCFEVFNGGVVVQFSASYNVFGRWLLYMLQANDTSVIQCT